MSSGPRSRTGPRAWRRSLLAALGGGLLGAAAGGAWLASPWGGYLELQLASDALHRLVIFSTPGAVVVLVLLWLLGEAGRAIAWLGRASRVLASAALALLVGGPTLVVVFDRGLEERGLAGSLVRPPGGPPDPGPRAPGGEAWPELGPAGEESRERPGVASAALPDGSRLILTPRTLARQRLDGSFAWSRARPGRPPGGLATSGGRVLVTGRGPDFEDDQLLAALELSSGRLLWSLHVLGWSVSPPVASGDAVAFVAARPATCELHLLRPGAPADRSSIRIPGPCAPLPPRLGAETIDVAVGPELVRFARREPWRPPVREVACDAPARWEVACRDGQVVGWAPAEEHHRP